MKKLLISALIILSKNKQAQNIQDFTLKSVTVKSNF